MLKAKDIIKSTFLVHQSDGTMVRIKPDGDSYHLEVISSGCIGDPIRIPELTAIEWALSGDVYREVEIEGRNF